MVVCTLDVEYIGQLVGLGGATITEVTACCRSQLVDIVGVTVFYANFERGFAMITVKWEADDYVVFYAISFVWQSVCLYIQPSWECCVTSIYFWTLSRHSCSCSSLETIPVVSKTIIA